IALAPRPSGSRGATARAKGGAMSDSSLDRDLAELRALARAGSALDPARQARLWQAIERRRSDGRWLSDCLARNRRAFVLLFAGAVAGAAIIMFVVGVRVHEGAPRTARGRFAESGIARDGGGETRVPPTVAFGRMEREELAMMAL